MSKTNIITTPEGDNEILDVVNPVNGIIKDVNADAYVPRTRPPYLTDFLITNGNGLIAEEAKETIDRLWCPQAGQTLSANEQHWCAYLGALRPMLINRRHRMLNENEWDMNEPFGNYRLIYKANTLYRIFKRNQIWAEENHVVHPRDKRALRHMDGDRFLLMPIHRYYNEVLEFFNALHYQYNNNTIEYPELEMLANAYFNSGPNRSQGRR